MRKFAVIAAVACLSVTVQAQSQAGGEERSAQSAPATNPFVGTWKLNPALSQTVMAFEPVQSGMIRYSMGGSNLRYTFGPDETHRLMDPLGKGRVAGQQVDSSTWRMTRYTDQGEVLWTDTWKLSSDGQTLTTTETNSRGQATIISERVTGDGGLFGTWKWKLGGVSHPTQFDIQPFGDRGLAFMPVEYGATCKADLDEKDEACVGPGIPDGMTMALKQTGPRAFEATAKQSGKVLFVDTYIVSPDGRMLVNESKPDSMPTPLGWVYDRQ